MSWWQTTDTREDARRKKKEVARRTAGAEVSRRAVTNQEPHPVPACALLSFLPEDETGE